MAYQASVRQLFSVSATKGLVLKVVLGIVAALCWVGSLLLGFGLLLNPEDRSVVGWTQMLLIVLMTFGSLSTGIVLLLLAKKDRPRLGNAGWGFIALAAIVWVDVTLALWIVAALPLFGVWLLVRWFRQKPPVNEGAPPVSE